MNFVLSRSAKYSVGGDTLSNELQQLGLPKGKIKFWVMSFFFFFWQRGCSHVVVVVWKFLRQAEHRVSSTRLVVVGANEAASVALQSLSGFVQGYY